MDAGQAGAFVKIIEQAGAKLKAISALPEGDKDMALAWKAFYTQVFTKLYEILREDQHEKFRDYVAELKEARKKRALYKGRPGKVYIPDKGGRSRHCAMNSRGLQEMGIHHMNRVSCEKRLNVLHRDIHQFLSCLQRTPRNMRRNTDIFGL